MNMTCNAIFVYISKYIFKCINICIYCITLKNINTRSFPYGNVLCNVSHYFAVYSHIFVLRKGLPVSALM